MSRKFLAKAALGLFAAAAIAVAAGWFAFVPFAKEKNYQFVASWGGKGEASGQFNDPTGIVVSGGEVFVADARNGRIQVFDLEGGFVRSFGRPGTGFGELGRPMNLAVYRDELYVPEYFNDRIQVFDLAGSPKRIIGQAGAGGGAFDAPGGIAVGDDGTLYVADFYNQRIQRLKADGSFVRQWGMTGEAGIWAGQFGYPTDVALGPNGALYVADGYNDRVQVFAPDGEFSRKWGGPLALNLSGPFNNWFATATGISVDDAGNVFVADFYNHRIQKFSADGTFLSSFGVQGSGPGQFLYPMAIALAGDGSVFVTDYGNNRIQKWRPDPAASPRP